jgi:glutamate-1-semialdehyde 2,1-aminomutase
MFAPGQWPAYFRECRGCDVWDTDGRHYVDFSYNGIGACLLGFRDPDVTRAVTRRLNLGSMCTLNPPEELELADKLCSLHPWAEHVRFARTGGEAAAIAVRIARATTGRSKVAICGYHGWHDWYLAANLAQQNALDGHLLPGLSPAGVPRELAGTALTFAFDDSTAFARILEHHGQELACVIMEPCRHRPPAPDFLETVRNETRRRGIPLIFDEITVGFRLALGGAHLRLGIQPDMAVFAKALGNGHPIAAVIGTRDVMEAAQSSFISSTYWTEGIGPAAALACLAKMENVQLAAHLADVGKQVRQHWITHARSTGLPVRVSDGFDCMPRFSFEHPQSNELKTLYTQTMLRLGALATTALYPTLAHDARALALHDALVKAAFETVAEIVHRHAVTQALQGPEAHCGFRRLVD